METISFRYAEDDVVAGNLSYYRDGMRRPQTRALWVLCGLLIAAILAFILAPGDSWPAWGLTIAGALIGGGAALVAIHWLNIAYLRRYARRNFAQQRSLTDTYTFTWDDRGFESRSDRGSQKLDWADLHRWSEADTLMMLYLAERLYIAVPKAAMSSDQLTAMRGQLSHALPGRGHPA